MSELTVKKTVGVPSLTKPGEKDYRIHLSDGESYLAEKCSTNKYMCNGFEGRIKDIKQKLCEGNISDEEEIVLFESKDPSWRDCIDPCALLTLAYQNQAIQAEIGQEILNTLNHYGWLSHPEGELLVEESIKEWERIEKLKIMVDTDDI